MTRIRATLGIFDKGRTSVRSRTEVGVNNVAVVEVVDAIVILKGIGLIPYPLLIVELCSSCLLPPASCLAFTIVYQRKGI